MRERERESVDKFITTEPRSGSPVRSEIAARPRETGDFTCRNTLKIQDERLLCKVSPLEKIEKLPAHLRLSCQSNELLSCDSQSLAYISHAKIIPLSRSDDFKQALRVQRAAEWSRHFLFINSFTVRRPHMWVRTVSTVCCAFYIQYLFLSQLLTFKADYSPRNALIARTLRRTRASLDSYSTYRNSLTFILT